MVDANKIRLSPIDTNKIVVDGNSINLECEPSLPSGWEAAPDVKVIGGSNVKGNLTDPKKVNR